MKYTIKGQKPKITSQVELIEVNNGNVNIELNGQIVAYFNAAEEKLKVDKDRINTETY